MAVDPVGAGVEAGGSLLGGLFGLFSGMNDRAASRRALERALKNYQNIPLPELQRMIAEQQGPSAMEGVSADPALEGMQNESLGELGRISDNGGMTLEDKANYEAAQRDAAQGAQRQRQSILNVLRRSGSGMAGGAGVAAQLGAAGDQQEATALAGQRMTADAQKRATQAVLERGKLAGAQRAQGFDEKSRRAAAADAISRYNATARQTAQNYNVGLPQQQWNNQMHRASAEANALGGVANQYSADADRTQRTWANAGTGAGQAAAGFVGSGKATAAPKTSYSMLDTVPDDKIDWGY